jgi:hypothetical protein
MLLRPLNVVLCNCGVPVDVVKKVLEAPRRLLRSSLYFGHQYRSDGASRLFPFSFLLPAAPASFASRWTGQLALLTPPCGRSLSFDRISTRLLLRSTSDLGPSRRAGVADSLRGPAGSWAHQSQGLGGFYAFFRLHWGAPAPSLPSVVDRYLTDCRRICCYICTALKTAPTMKYIGNLTSDARGKLNGMVFTRGRYGAVIRTKVSPVQPSSPAQSLVKQNFGALSASWRGLSEDQRAAWNAAVEDYKRTNVFGQQYTQSGLNLYVGLNQNLLQAELAAILSPAAPEELPVLQSFGIVADVSLNSIIWTLSIDAATNVPAGYSIIVDATPPVSPGLTYVKNKFATIQVVAGGSDMNLTNLRANYVARFGALVAGQVIYLRAKAINNTTGQATITVSDRTIVVA